MFCCLSPSAFTGFCLDPASLSCSLKVKMSGFRSLGSPRGLQGTLEETHGEPTLKTCWDLWSAIESWFTERNLDMHFTDRAPPSLGLHPYRYLGAATVRFSLGKDAAACYTCSAKSSVKLFPLFIAWPEVTQEVHVGSWHLYKETIALWGTCNITTTKVYPARLRKKRSCYG